MIGRREGKAKERMEREEAFLALYIVERKFVRDKILARTTFSN